MVELPVGLIFSEPELEIVHNRIDWFADDVNSCFKDENNLHLKSELTF